MYSFHSNCLMGFSIEDCRIYDISYMWPILFIQFLLCTIVLIIKIIMIKRAYRLYILFHEFRSPFLLYLQEKTRIKIELPVKQSFTWTIKKIVSSTRIQWLILVINTISFSIIKICKNVYWSANEYVLQDGWRQQGFPHVAHIPPIGIGIESSEVAFIMNTSSL